MPSLPQPLARPHSRTFSRGETLLARTDFRENKSAAPELPSGQLAAGGREPRLSSRERCHRLTEVALVDGHPSEPALTYLKDVRRAGIERHRLVFQPITIDLDRPLVDHPKRL
jgi:hypothetical protein